MKLTFLPFSLALALFCQNAIAQSKVPMAVNKADTAFCIPQIEGVPRPKGLVLHQEIITSHRISSTDVPRSVNGNAEVETSRRRQIKIKAPLINNPGLKVAIGFNYKVEDNFIDDVAVQTFDFYRNIEDKNLKSIGTTAYVVKPLRGNKFLLVRGSVSLNGDYQGGTRPGKEYLRFSVAPLLAWKAHDNLSYGFGIGYSENFGRITFLPLLTYNQTFNERWGIESLFPVQIKLRYSSLNKKNYLGLVTKGEATNYNVNFGEVEQGYLSQTEVKYFLNYERELYDFIWLGLEVGMRSNINFTLAETPDRRKSTVIDNSVTSAFFVGGSIFLVPPRKMYDK